MTSETVPSSLWREATSLVQAAGTETHRASRALDRQGAEVGVGVGVRQSGDVGRGGGMIEPRALGGALGFGLLGDAREVLRRLRPTVVEDLQEPAQERAQHEHAGARRW